MVELIGPPEPDKPTSWQELMSGKNDAQRKNVFRRYGSDINALSKIVVRIKPENWLRTIKAKEIILSSDC